VRILKLGDFCRTGSGGTPTRSKKEYYQNGRIPWIKSGELNKPEITTSDEFITEAGLKGSAAKLLEPGAIFIALYGATVGQVSKLRIQAATNQAICHIYPNKDICDENYLFSYIKASRHVLLSKRVGGGQPNISQQIVRDLKIPLPPLEEQKRIAKILDAADALRAKRRQAIAQLDTFLQSTFLDLFGDPVTNPKGWEEVPLPSLSVKFCDGPFGSNLKTEHYRESGVRVIRLQDIGIGEMIDDDLAYISEEHYATLPKNHCQPYDVIIGTMGDPNIRACIVPSSLSRCLNKADCLLFRADNEKVTPLYLCHLLNCPATVQASMRLVRGQTRGRISLGRLKQLKVPQPPLDSQQHFASIVESIEQQKSKMLAHLSQLDTLFASLQQRAFKGEL